MALGAPVPQFADARGEQAAATFRGFISQQACKSESTATRQRARAVREPASSRTARARSLRGIRAPGQNSIMERWFRPLRAELADRTLIWSARHLVRLLRESEEHYNSHRPHRSLGQATPIRPLLNNVIGLDGFRVRRNDRAGGVIHEYTRVA
ncbi:transposase InsO family protein [Catenulispora sp. GAS73]|uniref:integrase core domain-containing protein n=1 Tax=Catenulispora sp. GAS73 TaxID=3156269 RepID=UPI0035140A18